MSNNRAQVQMNPALALMFYFYCLEIVVIFGKELPYPLPCFHFFSTKPQNDAASLLLKLGESTG